MEKRTIVCGKCKKTVTVHSLNRVRVHKVGPGGRTCPLSGAYAQYAVNGKRCK